MNTNVVGFDRRLARNLVVLARGRLYCVDRAVRKERSPRNRVLTAEDRRPLSLLLSVVPTLARKVWDSLQLVSLASDFFRKTITVTMKMPTQAKETEEPLAFRTASPRQLHSFHGLLRDRLVEGKFEINEQPYHFSFAPATAGLADGKLVLKGRLTVNSKPLDTNLVDNVEARLIGQQGGVGAARRPAAVADGYRADQSNCDCGAKLSRKRAGDDLQPDYIP